MQIIWIIFILLTMICFKLAKNKKYKKLSVSNPSLEIAMVSESFEKKNEISKKEAIENLISEFVPPKTMPDAYSQMLAAITTLSKKYDLDPKNFNELWTQHQVNTKEETERKLRKKANDAYKNRAEKAFFIESITFYLFHIKFYFDNPELQGNISVSIKRLTKSLNHKYYMPICIGFLYTLLDNIKSFSSEASQICRDEIYRLFSNWYSHIQAQVRYEENISKLSKNNSASDKHFILNELVHHLYKEMKFEPSVRDELVSLCREDIRLYKQFLTESTDFYKKGISFEEALESKFYICPHLPSFEILWSIYEEEKNESEMLILQKIASEIRYHDTNA